MHVPKKFSQSAAALLALLFPLGFEAYSQAPLRPDPLPVSSPSSPRVGFFIERESGGKGLRISLTVEPANPRWPSPRVKLGLAAGKHLVLEGSATPPRNEKGWAQYDFFVTYPQLGGEALDALRLAFEVEWLNSEAQLAQREHFFMSKSLPAYFALGTNPAHWEPFDLAGFEKKALTVAKTIRVSWQQPVAGTASVVIDDLSGKRLRNLVSGKRFPAGPNSVVWDGLDEKGAPVAPGSYRWKVAAHPGIRPEFLMSFYNPGNPGWPAGPTSLWLGDHSSPMAAASNGSLVALGCPVAESGNNIAIVGSDGIKYNGAKLPHSLGFGSLFLALDEKRFYAVAEGRVRGATEGVPLARVGLVAWNSEDGSIVPYPGSKDGLKVLSESRSGIGDALGSGTLSGLAYLAPNLFVSLRNENKILVVDAKSGDIQGEIALAAPGALATDGRSLFAISGGTLAVISQPKTGAPSRTLFPLPMSKPRPNQETAPVASALAISPQGEFFVADNGTDQNVKVFDSAGRLRRQIGRILGRPPQGAWAPDGMLLPAGIALDGAGQLWVAENGATPKRVSVWDAKSGKIVREFFGPTHYGAAGGGFDAQDASRWVGGGALWHIDLPNRRAQIQSALYAPKLAGHPNTTFRPFNVTFVHRDGRTFLIAKDSVMRLYELKPDKSAKLWAMIGTLHAYQAEEPRWWVPEVFTQHPALREYLKDFTIPAGARRDFRDAKDEGRLGRDTTILWSDGNGDDIAQKEELQIGGGQALQMRSTIWGYQFNSLDWKMVVTSGEKTGLAPLPLKGFLPSGAPDWNLKEAFEKIRYIENFPSQNTQSFAMDGAGRYLFNGEPMSAVDASGEVIWTFPNDWAGVHASQKAPLPVRGVLQGSLSYLGVAPLDAEGDVTVVNGNHGRFYVLTTDGMYLDEIFQDVRLSRDPSAYLIGGECFGGFFGKDQKTNRYLLQSGHSDYRIFALNGLDQVSRFRGTVDVSADQLAAAATRARTETPLAASRMTRFATVPNAPDNSLLAEWGDPSRPFPFARVFGRREGGDLILQYRVKDPSPWKNQGVDPQLLFKTGDAVVFEFSTAPSEPRKSSSPRAGDKRLILAPFQGQSIAMLYDYVVPGTEDPVAFHSPWRAAKVDRVTQLENVDIHVRQEAGGYEVQARIPLQALGLPPSGTPANLLGDFGVIYGDEDGRINILRSYWNNQETGLVNDVPGETMIEPSSWAPLQWK